MEVLNFEGVSVKSAKTDYKELPDTSTVEPVTTVTVVLGDVAPDMLAELHRLSRTGNLQVNFLPMQASFGDTELKKSVGEVLNKVADEVNSGALDTPDMKVTASVTTHAKPEKQPRKAAVPIDEVAVQVELRRAMPDRFDIPSVAVIGKWSDEQRQDAYTWAKNRALAGKGYDTGESPEEPPAFIFAHLKPVEA